MTRKEADKILAALRNGEAVKVKSPYGWTGDVKLSRKYQVFVESRMAPSSQWGWFNILDCKLLNTNNETEK